MTFLRWCHHCQKRTAHHDVHLPPGLIWVNGKRHHYPTEWSEIYCSRCNAHTMEYLGDDDEDEEDNTPSDSHLYHATTTDEAS